VRPVRESILERFIISVKSLCVRARTGLRNAISSTSLFFSIGIRPLERSTAIAVEVNSGTKRAANSW